MDFLIELKTRNELLFFFGLTNFGLAILFVVFSKLFQFEIMGVNSWYKPIKFALSIGTYSWTMAWLMYLLPEPKGVDTISWIIIIMLGFEVIYIAVQASRGQLSHYNTSTPVYANLYALMALAATVVAFVTLFVAIQFFDPKINTLPDYYLWAIRMGLILFFIFSMEGFTMGARLTHTIGGPDGGEGIPFLNWSTRFGDPRVAHFIGMHALQVLPLLSFYLLKNTKATFVVAILYALLAFYTLYLALKGKPLFNIK